ncbi:hypothetical protein KM1_107920 [Entamoeba histolytica HM-3:IMSS]|uniref:Uncharacterized protein n=1 Tax=Entamoeba histolytica HM-3:IMSS TaxID=885315 RepID=M7X4E4_ENTHI|nr:hypothetical protein KM1_107920 [Entamoeba histolytica HM-3:IMSS]
MMSESKFNIQYNNIVQKAKTFLSNNYYSPLHEIIRYENKGKDVTPLKEECVWFYQSNFRLLEKYGNFYDDDYKDLVCFIIEKSIDKEYKLLQQNQRTNDNNRRLAIQTWIGRIQRDQEEPNNSQSKDLFIVTTICLIPYLTDSELKMIMGILKKYEEILAQIVYFIISYNFIDCFDQKKHFRMTKQEIERLKVEIVSLVDIDQLMVHNNEETKNWIKAAITKVQGLSVIECPKSVKEYILLYDGIDFNCISKGCKKLITVRMSNLSHGFIKLTSKFKASHPSFEISPSEQQPVGTIITYDFYKLIQKHKNDSVWLKYLVTLPYQFYKEGLEINGNEIKELFTSIPIAPLLVSNKKERINNKEYPTVYNINVWDETNNDIRKIIEWSKTEMYVFIRTIKLYFEMFIDNTSQLCTMNDCKECIVDGYIHDKIVNIVDEILSNLLQNISYDENITQLKQITSLITWISAKVETPELVKYLANQVTTKKLPKDICTIIFDSIEEYFILSKQKAKFLDLHIDLIKEFDMIGEENNNGGICGEEYPMITFILIAFKMVQCNIERKSNKTLLYYPIDFDAKICSLISKGRKLRKEHSLLFILLIINYWLNLERKGYISKYRIRLDLFQYCDDIQTQELFEKLASEQYNLETINELLFEKYQLQPDLPNDENGLSEMVRRIIQKYLQFHPNELSSNKTVLNEESCYYFEKVTPNDMGKNNPNEQSDEVEGEKEMRNGNEWKDGMKEFEQGSSLEVFYSKEIESSQNSWELAGYLANYCIPHFKQELIKTIEEEVIENKGGEKWEEMKTTISQMKMSEKVNICQAIYSRIEGMMGLEDKRWLSSNKRMIVNEGINGYVVGMICSKIEEKQLINEQDIISLSKVVGMKEIETLISILIRKRSTTTNISKLIESTTLMENGIGKRLRELAIEWLNSEKRWDDIKNFIYLGNDLISTINTIKARNDALPNPTYLDEYHHHINERIEEIKSIRSDVLGHIKWEEVGDDKIKEILENDIDGIKELIKEPYDGIEVFVEKIIVNVDDPTMVMMCLWIMMLKQKNIGSSNIRKIEDNEVNNSHNGIQWNQIKEFSLILDHLITVGFFTIKCITLDGIEHMFNWTNMTSQKYKTIKSLLESNVIFLKNPKLNHMFNTFTSEKQSQYQIGWFS